MATHATIPVDHDTKARFIRHVAAMQARFGRRVTHSEAINSLLAWAVSPEGQSVSDSDPETSNGNG